MGAGRSRPRQETEGDRKRHRGDGESADDERDQPAGQDGGLSEAGAVAHRPWSPLGRPFGRSCGARREAVSKPELSLWVGRFWPMNLAHCLQSPAAIGARVDALLTWVLNMASYVARVQVSPHRSQARPEISDG